MIQTSINGFENGKPFIHSVKPPISLTCKAHEQSPTSSLLSPKSTVVLQIFNSIKWTNWNPKEERPKFRLSTICLTLTNADANFATPRRRPPGKHLPRSKDEVRIRNTEQRKKGTLNLGIKALIWIKRLITRKPNSERSLTVTVVINITTANALTLTNPSELQIGTQIVVSKIKSPIYLKSIPNSKAKSKQFADEQQ